MDEDERRGLAVVLIFIVVMSIGIIFYATLRGSTVVNQGLDAMNNTNQSNWTLTHTMGENGVPTDSMDYKYVLMETPRGGGGGGNNNMVILPEVPKEPTQSIINLQLCKSPEPCEKTNPWNNSNIYVYWQVENGVGCCNSYYCSYEQFVSNCVNPFTLYEIILDDQKYEWKNTSDWEYICSTETPWNYFYYHNVSEGTHSITINQKDCFKVVDSKSIQFTVTKIDNGYDISQTGELIK